ncbi:MAG: DUF503 domain-containing protein [Deltaproteobacteria bacterium]|nr:DUF503 domain-containing protein [Deltaproteobacteria bacterium]MBW2084512.1 DUF503 domain-containing protein [Deltaproteobacteria bacterium]
MVVGILRVTMIIPGNSSLKGKRKVVKSLLGKLRAKFNLAAAEVEDNDLWQRAGLGLALVGNDRRYINSAMDKVLDFIERTTEAEIIDSQTEIINIF